MSREQVRAALTERIALEEMIAVELKSEHKLIGNLYLGKREFDAMELGYVFNKSYWRCGYAAESCRAIIKRSFEAGVHRIFAECDPLNESSWRLLESLGFAREAHLRENIYFHKDENGRPIWKDTYIYALRQGSQGAKADEVKDK